MSRQMNISDQMFERLKKWKEDRHLASYSKAVEDLFKRAVRSQTKRDIIRRSITQVQTELNLMHGARYPKEIDDYLNRAYAMYANFVSLEENGQEGGGNAEEL